MIAKVMTRSYIINSMHMTPSVSRRLCIKLKDSLQLHLLPSYIYDNWYFYAYVFKTLA
jgi:hypothetical protein